MSIDEFVKKGYVEEVKVLRATRDIIELGKKQYPRIFKKKCSTDDGLPSWFCQDNSMCVVKAMHEIGEFDWHVVPGFARNPRLEEPTAHFWVRKGEIHYDPTWSLNFCDFNFQDVQHYRLIKDVDSLPAIPEGNDTKKVVKWGDDSLNKLNDLERKWKAEIHRD